MASSQPSAYDDTVRHGRSWLDRLLWELPDLAHPRDLLLMTCIYNHILENQAGAIQPIPPPLGPAQVLHDQGPFLGLTIEPLTEAQQTTHKR
jgi:hypothetical protein